jgi:hypothetical protein
MSWRTRSSAPASASTTAWPERWHLPAISQGGVGLTRSFYRADDVLLATLSSSPAYHVLARMTVAATAIDKWVAAASAALARGNLLFVHLPSSGNELHPRVCSEVASGRWPRPRSRARHKRCLRCSSRNGGCRT